MTLSRPRSWAEGSPWSVETATERTATRTGARALLRVRADVSEAQACKTLAHELAHIDLAHEHEHGRSVKEIEAESVAYIVANASGIATSAYSLPYVAQWAGGDVKTVRATAERVVASAQRILRAIETQPAVAVRMVAA